MQKLLKKPIAACTAVALAASMMALPVGAAKADASEPAGAVLQGQTVQVAAKQAASASDKKAATKKTTSTKKTDSAKKPAAKKKAAKKPAMAKLKLRWTLKKNKKLSITEPYAGVGAKPSQIVMKNYKVKNASNKPGYKVVSFDVVKTLNWKLTPESVHKIMNTNYYVDTESPGGGVFVAVVDRETGKSLAVKNKHNVTVRASVWDATASCKKKTKYVTDPLRCHALALYKQTKIHIAITYPKTYKNLCIGIGGYNKLAETKADKLFWKGTGTFAKTSYYVNAKSKSGKKLNSYWMRVK